MDSRRRKRTGRHGCLLLGLAAIALAGCTSSQESLSESMQVAQMLYGAGQNDAIVQGNAEKAADALERAAAETCAEAAPYRSAAEQAGGPVAAMAEESSTIREDFQTEMAQQDRAAQIASQFTSRRDQSWDAFRAAQDELREIARVHYYDDQGQPIGVVYGELRDTTSVGRVWDSMDRLFNSLRDVSRDLLTAAEDLRFAMRTPEGDTLAAWGDPEADLPGMLDSLVDGANALNDRWIALTMDEVRIPSDRSTLVGGMDGSDRRALEDLLGQLMSGASDATTLRRESESAVAYFSGMQERFERSRVEKTRRTVDIADETGRLAAEAMRNAWLAVEACGGEVPPEYGGLIRDPFDEYRAIPQWNSTFWDISSP
ncbi:MAG: hypothetical protein R3F16_22975 [Myxococcota bacterium]|nr:hypothetical protein [Myxococcales bacterium]